ncbi:MAG: PSD1 and planctomycete cytochrome C domain-containing protein [Luteolibacter sp.]
MMRKTLMILPVACFGVAFLFSGCDRQSGIVALTDIDARQDVGAGNAGRAAKKDGIPDFVTFNAHIRPILSDACFSCHGFDPETREAGLRLDTPEGAYAALRGTDTDFAIVPGNAERSEVFARIISQDPEEMMPPPYFHKDPLTPHQIALVRRWIEQGAEYEAHWSFVPIVRSDPPVPEKYEDLLANPIDAFVLDRLEREGIEPSPRASRSTLLRRLSLDLTGLPPTPDEVDAFVADASPDAYEKQVGRLLASPRYGERMAAFWLDVARYTDTAGYHGDQGTRVFPYRDYVIRAFNDNMPFDRFTREQLAGDLLESPTDDQRIATGFLRLNMMTREGGAQPDEYMAKYMGDRIRTFGGAFLGLTTGCAECHDHKFDPITAKDYYSLGAFFADIRQWGLYTNYSNQPNPDLAGWSNQHPFPPEIHVHNTPLLERIEKLRGNVVAMLAGLVTESDLPAIEAWGTQAAEFLAGHPDGWSTLIPVDVDAGQGTEASILDDGSVLLTGKPGKDGKITIRLPLPDVAISSVRFEALPDDANQGSVGRGDGGRFSVKPSFAIQLGDAQPTAIKLAWSQADKRTPHRYDTMGNHSSLLEDEWRSGPARWEFPLDAAKHPQTAIHHLAVPLAAATGRVLVITLETNDLGRARFSVTPFAGAIPGFETAHRRQLVEALGKTSATRSESDQREIAAAWLHGARSEKQLPAAYIALRDAILECRAGYAHSMVVDTLPDDQHQIVRHLPRGDWMNPGDVVEPAFPAFLVGEAPVPADRRLNRLDLANWLMADENPLTSRHFMNRLWGRFFGRGISGIIDDLGSQGEMPSHPELLDWLAAEFKASGWDVKHMVRLLVTSHTYQQEAATREDLLENDPENELLAGQSARRLEAEFIRDNALAISGLLNGDIIGGPSALPYQPEGYYENLNFPIRDYPVTLNDNQYRRGIYMHWQRTFLHPMLAAFDAPSREECTPSRFQANSPQQALVLLNDPTFVEAARAFAQRVMDEKPDADDETRIRHALKAAVARDPRDGEIEPLIAFLAQQREAYRARPGEAAVLVRTGLSGSAADGDLPELAAWTQLCRVILNLHETITRY